MLYYTILIYYMLYYTILIYYMLQYTILRVYNKYILYILHSTKIPIHHKVLQTNLNTTTRYYFNDEIQRTCILRRK